MKRAITRIVRLHDERVFLKTRKMDAVQREATEKSNEQERLLSQQAEDAMEIQAVSSIDSSSIRSSSTQNEDHIIDINEEESAETLQQLNLEELNAETEWDSVLSLHSRGISTEDNRSIKTEENAEQNITIKEIELCLTKTVNPVTNGGFKTFPSVLLSDNEEGDRCDGFNLKRANSTGRTERRTRKSSLFSRKTRGFSNISISLSAPHIPSRESLSNSFNVGLRSWLQPMDNKMNMKVFGSRKAMVDEQIRYRKAGWIIHPTSVFRWVV